MRILFLGALLGVCGAYLAGLEQRAQHHQRDCRGVLGYSRSGKPLALFPAPDSVMVKGEKAVGVTSGTTALPTR